MGRFLIHMLGANRRPGYAMYARLRSAQAQHDAILGAASEAFPKKYNDLLECSLLLISQARRLRNEFAHHIWVRNPKIPGALIKMNPSEILDYEVDLWDHLDGHQPDKDSLLKGFPDLDFNKIGVFFKEDFIEALRLFHRADGYVYFLIKLVVEKPPYLEGSAETLRMMPEIQSALQRRRRGKEEPLEAPPPSPPPSDPL